MTPRRRAAVVAVAVAVAAGCGGRYRKLPSGRGTGSITRAPTAGDAVLALLPEGPDVVIELDLARARGNPLIGPVVDGWIGSLEAGDLPLAGATGRPPLAGAAWVVLAAYGVGGADPTTVTLVAPGRGVEIPNAVKIADGVVALGPPAWLERLQHVEPGASAADDRELLALRSRAMPTGADGAVVRVTARLSDDARIALAGAIGLDPAPRALSAWIDIADDAAAIVDVDARDDGDPAAVKRMRSGLERFLRRIADHPDVRALGIAPSIARTRIEVSRRGTWLRAVTVVPPARLKWAVAQARGEPPAEAPAEPEAP